MTDPGFARIGAALIQSIRITFPQTGPWTAEVEFIEAPALSGQVTIQLGADTLTGTIIPTEDGTFGLKRQCMIVAGAGAWGTVLAPKHYHNDAGVRAQLIAADAARECGEVLGDFTPTTERVGVDYVRSELPAALTLQAAAGGNPWWVDAAGVTQVGLRATSPGDPERYELLAFNPHTRRGTLAMDSITAVGIGTILTERLDQPQTIRELVITVDGGDGLRAEFWSGAAASPLYSELAQILSDIIASQFNRRRYGKYTYRVVQQRADGRVDVQSVRAAAGVPDQQTIRLFPGIPGLNPELTPGAIVLVEFLEGDPTQPVITGFVGLNGSGFAPVQLVIGGESGAAAARVGDDVAVAGAGTYVTFDTHPPSSTPPPPVPMTLKTPYLISFSQVAPTIGSAAKATGEITSGSDKVDIS